jgi:hypothetical protein
LATSCREISTLSSGMAFHIKLGGQNIGKRVGSNAIARTLPKK